MKRLSLLLFVLALPQTSYSQTKPKAGLFAGLDLYGGLSNIPGLRRFSDQLWAGNQIFTPSVAYLRWESGQSTSARVAVGVGDAARGSNALYKQPVELWVKQKSGAGSLTAGRFFTPFGQQEWQYETKEGLQWEQPLGPLALTVALQKDPLTRRGNAYVRLVHAPEESTQVGLSLAGGKGFSYGTDFEQGVAVDATLTRGPWLLRTEWDYYTAPRGQRFPFGMATATYQGLRGGIRPFASYYTWKDTSSAATFGDYSALIGGVGFPITAGLSAEAATTKAGSRQNTWLQLHFTWEH